MEIRNRYFEFASGIHGITLKYSPCAYYGNRQLSISPGWGILFLSLGDSGMEHDVNDYDEYGFSYHDSSVWLSFGKKRISFRMPWHMVFFKANYLLKDGTWKTRDRNWDRLNRLQSFERQILGKFEEKHAYKYILLDGNIQEVIATISVVEREWRPLWFMWTNVFSKKIKVIEVEFDNEAGERRGSWKGGTIGCSFELKESEKPVDALRRMEIERRFN